MALPTGLPHRNTGALASVPLTSSQPSSTSSAVGCLPTTHCQPSHLPSLAKPPSHVALGYASRCLLLLCGTRLSLGLLSSWSLSLLLPSNFPTFPLSYPSSRISWSPRRPVSDLRFAFGYLRCASVQTSDLRLSFALLVCGYAASDLRSPSPGLPISDLRPPVSDLRLLTSSLLPLDFPTFLLSYAVAVRLVVF